MTLLQLTPQQKDQLHLLCKRLLGVKYKFGAEVSMTDTIDKIKEIDCCLPESTYVFTVDRGSKKITDLRIGEEVYSVDLNTNGLVKNKVIGIKSYGVKELYKIKVQGRDICATDNHPFLVFEKYVEKQHLNKFRLVWKKVSELNEGDLLTVPKRIEFANKLKRIGGYEITTNFMRFIGAMIGDGSVSEEQVNLCIFDKDEIELYSNIIKELFNKDVSFHKSNGISFRDSRFTNFIRYSDLSVESSKKTIPQWVYETGEANIKALLQGYLDTDGSLSKRGYYEYKASSEVLIDQVRYLYMMLGYNVSRMSITRRTKDIYIKGVKVKNAKPLYCFEVYPDTNRTYGGLMDGLGKLAADRLLKQLGDSLCVKRINSITKVESEAVYDIEIENTHNFLANGFVVHNSEMTQWLFYQLGLIIRDGSFNQYADSKTVKDVEVGDLVFKIKNGAINHVGVIMAVSPNIVCEADGYRGKVVLTPFEKFSTPSPRASQYAGLRRLVKEKVLPVKLG